MPCSLLHIPSPTGRSLCELSRATVQPHASALCRCSTRTGPGSSTLRSRRLSGSPRLPRASDTCTPQSQRCPDSTASHHTAMSAVCSACSLCSDLAFQPAIRPGGRKPWARAAPCAWRQVIAAWLQVVWRDAKLENILMRSASCPFHAVSQCCIARGPQCSVKHKAVTSWQSMACSRLGKAACRDNYAPPVWASLQHSGMAAGESLEGLMKKGSSKTQGLQHNLDFESSLGSECCVLKKKRGYTHV